MSLPAAQQQLVLLTQAQSGNAEHTIWRQHMLYRWLQRFLCLSPTEQLEEALLKEASNEAINTSACTRAMSIKCAANVTESCIKTLLVHRDEPAKINMTENGSQIFLAGKQHIAHNITVHTGNLAAPRVAPCESSSFCSHQHLTHLAALPPQSG